VFHTFLVRAHDDVGHAVAGDVTRAHPHAEASERLAADQRRDHDTGRWTGEIEQRERLGVGAQLGTADHDRERPRADAAGVGAVVLARDQEIADAVAGDVVHGERVAGGLEPPATADVQDARVGHRGVERAAEHAVTEDQVDLAGGRTGEGRRLHGGEGVVAVPVAVAVGPGRDRDARRPEAVRPQHATEHAGIVGHGGEIDGGGPRDDGHEKDEEQAQHRRRS
jgi:hypothetical protein